MEHECKVTQSGRFTNDNVAMTKQTKEGTDNCVDMQDNTMKPSGTYINTNITQHITTNNQNTNHLNTQLSITQHTNLSPMTGKKLCFCIQTLLVLVMGYTNLSTGLAQAFVGSTLPQFTDPHTKDLILTPQETRLFGSLYGIGGLVGTCICGPMMVKLGQRTTLLLGILTSSIAWLVLIYTVHVPVILCVIFVQGVSFIFMITSINIYTIEVSFEKYRGLSSGIVTMCSYLGAMIPLFLGINGLTWRQIGVVCCGLPLISIIVILMIPNSPRWLITRNRFDDAWKALMFYRWSHQLVENEFYIITTKVNSGTISSVSHQLKLLIQPKTRKIYGILIILLFLVPLTGSPIIQTYLVVFMQRLDSEADPYIAGLLYQLILIFGIISHIFLVDKLGRKPIIIMTLALNSLLFVSLIISSYFSIPWLPLISVLLNAFIYGNLVPVCYTVQSELVPTSCRSVGVLLLSGFNFVGLFLGTWTYPLVVQLWGQLAAFGVFAVCNALLALICTFFLPETKGRILEQIYTESPVT